jgi:hypothetical protein
MEPVRLWSDIPWRERVTERDIARWWDPPRLRARVRTPGCHAAVRFVIGGIEPLRYAPCGQRPLNGTSFCRTHGGAPVQALPTMDFDGLTLTTRSVHALKRAGLTTQAAVAVTPDEQLLALRNFGATSLAEVRRHIPFNPEAQCVAHYQREGHRAAALAYERLVVEAAMAWADGWSPWSMQGIRTARTLLTLTAALVRERAALAGINQEGAETADRMRDVGSVPPEGTPAKNGR